MRKQIALFLLAGLLLLSGCAGNQKASEDILTQKGQDKDKIPVTVLVKYAFSINAFEKAVEERFPQLDLIQVGNYTGDRGILEYERRMEHDDLTDIVVTWPLEVGEQYWSDRLLDLSGMPFTSKYNTSMLNTISRSGKLYYLPGPAQVRGIVYNKTLFEEKGWEVPKDFDGFVSLCQTIEASGIRALQLGFGNSEVLDTAFVGYSYGDCFSKPKDTQWLSAYNTGVGDFGQQFGPALDNFQKMIDAGIWKKSDLDVQYPQREKMLFTRQCAMVEDSVLLARMGYEQNGCTDEFALMPFFNPGDQDNDWARLYMVCYIGLNKHLAEPQNKEKYDLVLQLMDYISSLEGQSVLSSDTGAMYSSLRDVPPPNVKEIEDLLPALEHGRYAIFPELKNAQSALREGLAGMLRGDTSRDELIRMVNEQNLTPPRTAAQTVCGSASADFSMIETGNFVTDAMREKSGSDVALFLDNGKDGRYTGKGISARLYQGNVTDGDIHCILPDLKHGEAGVLQTVTMTGENLLKTLEHAIPVDNNNQGWFYYFSGLRMTYAPSAQPGTRIRKITDAQGQKIDPQRIYSVAVMDGTVPEEFVESCENNGVSIHDLLIDTVRGRGTIAPSQDGRFIVAES